MKILAVDPGPTESAYVVYDTVTKCPIEWEKVTNEKVLKVITLSDSNSFAIECIASYGMAVGATVFETCIWVGRFIQCWCGKHDPIRVYRREVKLHLCGLARAKDSNIRQAIIDRYGPTKQIAVGLKASPGVLYGMKADCWQALGVAITAAETRLGDLSIA